MRKIRRHAHLLTGIGLMLVASPLTLPACEPGCLRERSVYVGEYGSKDAGLRASIPRLAAEVRRCPDTEVFRIIFIAPEEDPAHEYVDKRSLFYHRKLKTIGYEADLLSWYVGRTYLVQDSAIQALAESGGTLEDFAEYDNK